jgi:hypothetical protein
MAEEQLQLAEHIITTDYAHEGGMVEMRLPIEQVAHALDTFGGVHAREWLHQDAMVAFSLPFRWTKFRTAAESIVRRRHAWA